MRTIRQMAKGSALVILGWMLASGVVYAAQSTGPCVQPNNGAGTVSLPPACQYLTAQQLHVIVNGLPPGTILVLDPIHNEFVCGTPCRTPGGPLGGEVENFNSTATFQLSVSSNGSSPLTGWTRTVTVPLAVRVATGQRPLGASVQTFPTDMLLLQGSIAPGDPDFESFEVVGGTDNGLPSPGSTTLTQQANGDFIVDSYFDVRYRIRFVGARGGKLAGFGGTTDGVVRMKVQ